MSQLKLTSYIDAKTITVELSNIWKTESVITRENIEITNITLKDSSFIQVVESIEEMFEIVKSL